jgi:hypothetical protein
MGFKVLFDPTIFELIFSFQREAGPNMFHKKLLQIRNFLFCEKKKTANNNFRES